jgi:hypothetical protein
MKGWLDIELQLEGQVGLGDVVPCAVDGKEYEAEVVAVGPYAFEMRTRVKGLDMDQSYLPADLFGKAGIPMHINSDGWASTSVRAR